MKKVVLLAVVLAFVGFGCSDNGTNPESTNTLTNSVMHEKQFIPLPAPVDPNLSVEKWFFAGSWIDGSEGGEIELGKSYHSKTGEVEVEADLDIPEGAFEGSEFIFFFINDTYGTVDFFPGMAFDKELTFDLKFDGVNLSEIDNPDEISFAYLADDGSIVEVEYKSLKVDVKHGKISVKGAKIQHFSRFGFVK